LFIAWRPSGSKPLKQFKSPDETAFFKCLIQITIQSVVMKVKDFQNKVCWITGASSGIGAALAIALSNLGAYLILSARTTDNLLKVRSQCADADKVLIRPCDMEDLDALPDMALQAWKTFDGIDYVFLNAGFAVRDTVINTELELAKKVMSTNYFSAVVISKTLLPHMKERRSGCFVVTSSLAGKFGVPKLAAYSASKHALVGFFESLRAENETDGIKVSIVTPGFVNTNISVNALTGNGDAYGKMQQSLANGISPESCARAIIKAVAREKHDALIGGMEKYSVMIRQIFPRLFTSVIRRHPVQKLRMLGLFNKKPAL
jgi:short-subunit dehydrogenase